MKKLSRMHNSYPYGTVNHSLQDYRKDGITVNASKLILQTFVLTENIILIKTAKYSV